MWSYQNTVRIRFGVGSLSGIGDLIQGRAYCLVTYDEPIFHDIARRIAAIAGPAALTIDNVIPNPDFHMLADLSSTPPRWSPRAATASARSSGFSKTARARRR